MNTEFHMQQFKNTKFEDSVVELDQSEFYNCTFQGCTIVYSGGLPPTLVGCKFSDSRFEFAGAASNTLVFLTEMYAGLGDGGKELIEATFRNIRAGISIRNNEAVDAGR